MEDELVRVENLYFQYFEGDDWTINGVNFSIKRGEWVAIIGHNGSGKSTLAKMLNGLLLPNKGTITINGIELNEGSIWDARKMVGMVFQNPDNQFVGTTVKDDVAFGMENIGVPRNEMVIRVESSLEQVNMLDYLNQEPHHLSGGQKQRVAIAGALALRPLVLILDEATSMLDPIGRTEVLDTVRTLREESNMTVISITHDLNEAARADRIIVMNQGNIFAEGKPKEIFQKSEPLKEIGLDLPMSVQLSDLLVDKGINLSQRHLNEKELVDELWTLFLKK